MRVQDVIAEGIESQASWRDQKAEEYPDDFRNARAADGLKQLAEYVRRLPDNDPRVQSLNPIAVQPTGGDVFSPGAETDRLISRFCFDNDGTPPTDDQCSSFFDDVTEQAEREHIQVLKEGGIITDEEDDDGD
ncbi:MAG: hypothetical protein ACR2QA_02970 [Solirubrobacteraceae bacterium]